VSRAGCPADGPWAAGFPTPATLRQKLRDRLTLPGPEDAAAGLKRGDDLDGARILVPVLQIRPYDRNPRRAINPHFEEIKASIRAVGLLTPFNITRRPGEAHYMVCGGGNTRLTILQQLFGRGMPLRAGRAHLQGLAWRRRGHRRPPGRERTARRDVFLGPGRRHHGRQGRPGSPRRRPLSLRQLEAELKRLGLPVALANISLMKFALDRLAPLGQRLTGLDVKRSSPG
jgi:hypothetical protein